MSDTKFKPGSFWVDDLGEAHFLETNHRYAIGCKGGTGRVAKIEGVGDESLATAHLFSAAPDLLASCEATLQSLTQPGKKGNPSAAVLLRDLHAAIAKAKGTT